MEQKIEELEQDVRVSNQNLSNMRTSMV